MARIRTIKPQFWDDVKIARISRDARLLYIAMWTFSDDYGVVIGDSLWLKSKVFPYDHIQVQQFDKWLNELVSNGFICLLSHDGERFIYLPNFTRHQVINRPNTTDVNLSKDLLDRKLREITEQSLINHGTITEQSRTIIGEEKERDNTPLSTKVDMSPIAGGTSPQQAKGRFVKPSVDDIRQYCSERGNDVDAQRFYGFYESKGWMIGSSKMKDWKAAVRTWEQRERRSLNGAENKNQKEKISDGKRFGNTQAEDFKGKGHSTI